MKSMSPELGIEIIFRGLDADRIREYAESAIMQAAKSGDLHTTDEVRRAIIQGVRHYTQDSETDTVEGDLVSYIFAELLSGED